MSGGAAFPGTGVAAMMMGGMGNEPLFRAALQESCFASGSNAQLMLLLPSDLLQQALVPGGHLGDIAKKCQVRIDLGEELANRHKRVTVTGSVAANAMAAYFLQERLVQC